ncbi:MAG: hypothetical protein ACOYT7_00410 [Patescibacteria group bacterium]
MITVKDLNLIEKRLRSIFVTKEEFREALLALKSDFFDKLDAFVKEIRDSRDERTLMAHRISDHEDRITKLESRQTI